MKKAVAEILEKALKKISANLSEEEIEKLVEIPPSSEMGDFAFPCFPLAAILKKNPAQIAIEIKKQIRVEKEFEKIVVSGPYVNFFVDKLNFSEKTIEEILKKKNAFGKFSLAKKEKILVEFSQPNTHKAFHVGHIRGTSLGESISRILEFCGQKVIRANYSGDTGMHVAKWLWCYKKYHSREKLSDNEEWIASIYVDAVRRLEEKPLLHAEVDEINLKLESKKDKKLYELWKKTRRHSVNSWKKIYKELNAKFDKYFFESGVEKRGKQISLELLKKGIAEKSDGAVIMDLKKYNLGVWVLLRSDGTVLYSAKDLALAGEKMKKYRADKNISLHGSEQNLHFRQLFKTLEIMGIEKEKFSDIAFDMVRLPSGKMSSRTGENILYSDFMKEIAEHAKMEIKKRQRNSLTFSSQSEKMGRKISQKELDSRALKISIAAIKYSMLKQSANKVIVFDKKEALNFEGDTGPYLLYSYARAKSIIKKSKSFSKNSGKPEKIKIIDEKEIELAKKFSQFPEIVKNSFENLNPAMIANYSYQLSQTFNEFYHSCPVLGSEKQNFRIALVKSFVQVMENSFGMLGIVALEEM
ncbi:arginine--tRNA ligase [Candidatus Pacearchaeota archaeon]|nr:arginine--tRNA ligase [Candidatus Pacearchaeota archaeon]